MLLRLGDKGNQVAEIQKLLSLLGYDLVIDADFGQKTQRSVRAFQKKYGLTVDGIVGRQTYDFLKATQKRSAKEEKSEGLPENYEFDINRTYKLSKNQYIQQRFDKNQIFLHFTAGSAIAKNTISSWESDEPRIATPYLIDGISGEVFECYNPKYWSFHLGVKGTNGILDKHSIGIEICNYGPLQKKGNKYYAWPKDFSSTVVPSDKVYSLEREFRGFNYFEAFTDEQIESTELLLEHLIKSFNINIQPSFDYTWFDYDQSVIKEKKDGIWSHSTVRKDKFDLYPDHRIIEMLNRLGKKFNRQC